MRWMDEWLSDRERGGFYASQDADFSLDDDGDYFTWTRDEAARCSPPKSLPIARAYYDIGEIGDMHHNPAKNVLHVTRDARGRGEANQSARWMWRRELLVAAKKKLYAARLKRPTPYVDKTIYVAWNGMCISAYLEAARVLDMPEARAFALKSLDRVLAEAWTARPGWRMWSPTAKRCSAARVAGVLDDYVLFSAMPRWMPGRRPARCATTRPPSRSPRALVTRFYDPTGGGFFDTETAADGERGSGALSARRKPLQDSPTPAGNPMAAALLMRLEALNGRVDYAVKAQETLETFAGVVEHFGLYAATLRTGAAAAWCSAPCRSA